MNQGKTFKLFVSSTFSDFSVERRLLQEYVFPEIKRYCNESNLIFQPIDLRWGVSNEAQLDQKTLELCLEEVRASKINPHPNFLIMAGDRYGWIPLPYLIKKTEYETIVTNIEKEEDKELLNTWYKLDENQIPASYILSERKNEFVEYSNWGKIENHLGYILQNSVNKSSLSKDDKEKYFMSATEHEVIEGIFKYLNITPSQEIILQKNKAFLEIDSKNVYAYIRNIKSIDESFKNKFIDKDLKNVEKFKKGIKESIENNNILEVDIELENISKDNINGSLLYNYETIKNDKESSFVKIMIYNLKKSIDSYKNTIRDLSKDEIEALEQKSFKELKIKNFLGREETLQDIDKYLNNDNNQALVVYGKSGLGKSSLMAKAIDNAQNKYLNKKIVYRFVCSTVNLATTSDILISILKEIGINEEIRKIKNPQTLQEENEKIDEFYYRVYDHLKSIKEDTIIFIDAVDQLINEDEFIWLPKELPNNLKIVISALNDKNYKNDSKYFEDIKNRTKNIYELQAFDLNNARELVVNLLEKYNRKISKEQMNYLLDIYKNINSPLYLVVVAQDLKYWKSTDKNQTLEKTQKDAIISFINNLSNIHHHNKEFVKKVFAYISLTGGLNENELLELLSSDKEFLNKIAPETFHTNTTKELPIVIWSRLHTQIKEFIKIENIDNQSVMKFFHREFDNISKLTQDEHKHLVELLQNLMFKYQDKDFYLNRFTFLFIKIISLFLIKYNYALELINLRKFKNLKWIKNFINVFQNHADFYQKYSKTSNSISLKKLLLEIIDYVISIDIDNETHLIKEKIFLIYTISSSYAYINDTLNITKFTNIFENLILPLFSKNNEEWFDYYVYYCISKSLLLYKNNNYNKSISLLEELRILLEKNTQDHLLDSLSCVYQNLGIIYSENDKNDKALEVLNSNIKLLQNYDCFENKEADLANAYQTVALIYCDNKKNFKKALEYINLSNDIYKNLFNKFPNIHLKNYASSQNALAHIYSFLKEYDGKDLIAQDKAYSLIKNAYTTSSQENIYLLLLYTNNYASLLYKKRKLNESLKYIDIYREIYKMLNESNYEIFYDCKITYFNLTWNFYKIKKDINIEDKKEIIQELYLLSLDLYGIESDEFKKILIEIDILNNKVHNKINRNDPCICGSPKKYKKCCGK